LAAYEFADRVTLNISASSAGELGIKREDKHLSASLAPLLLAGYSIESGLVGAHEKREMDRRIAALKAPGLGIAAGAGK